MIKKLAISLLLAFILLGVSRIRAIEYTKPEASEPFINLSLNKKEAEPGDKLSFRIGYGNYGPEPAKNIKIALNQPLDGDSFFELITSEPNPDNLVKGKYGNLLEYEIGLIKPDLKNEHEIVVTVKIKEGSLAQTVTASANLEAPHREPGSRTIASNSVTLEVLGEAKESTASALEASPSSAEQEPTPVPSPTETMENKEKPFATKGFLPETIVKCAVLIGGALLITLGFVIGRKSIKK